MSGEYAGRRPAPQRWSVAGLCRSVVGSSGELSANAVRFTPTATRWRHRQGRGIAMDAFETEKERATHPYRNIPAVEALLSREPLRDLAGRLGRQPVLEAARAARPSLIPVINATGVILHTNLGRAPLAYAALE